MPYIFAIIVSLLLQSVAYGYVSTRYPSGNMMQFAFIACTLCTVFYTLSLRIWPVAAHRGEDSRAMRRIGVHGAVVCGIFCGDGIYPCVSGQFDGNRSGITVCGVGLGVVCR